MVWCSYGCYNFKKERRKAGACLGNYVIFENRDEFYPIYAGYYYGLLITAIVYAYIQSKAAAKNIRQSLYSLMIGYVLFMVPTTLVNIVDPSTISGIPSIMCGFAVLLAATLAGKVLPEYFDK